jgi:hypothetical protein
MKIRDLIAIIERSEKDPIILQTLKRLLQIHGETVSVDRLEDDVFDWRISI